MSEVRRLGPLLHLDESSPSHEWVRFDAPGDFQLCLRDDFVAIDGFDERDDPGLARRLEPQPAAASPPRLDREPRGGASPDTTATTIGRPPSTTDPNPSGTTSPVSSWRSSAPISPTSATSGDWPTSTLEEVSVGSAAGVRFTDALVAATRAAPPGRSPWNPFETAFALTYDSAHVLPHIVDSIVVSGRHAHDRLSRGQPRAPRHDRPMSFASSRPTARSRRSTPPTRTRWTSSRSPPTC